MDGRWPTIHVAECGLLCDRVYSATVGTKAFIQLKHTLMLDTNLTHRQQKAQAK